MVQQGTHRPARRLGRLGRVSAARIMAAAFGIGAGLLGLEHGLFETRQGSATPGGLVIHAIGPPCQPHTAWHGCEPALTIIPSFAATGIAAMLLAVAVLVWAAAFVTRPHGGLILLLLVAALFVAGGGFTTTWFGLPAAVAATQITAPPTRWRTWLGPPLTRLVAGLWPWLFLAYLAWAAGSWIVAAIPNAVMLAFTPAVTAATPFVLALILLSALAHDSQQSQAAPPAGAADHLGGRPPGTDDMDQHEAIPKEHLSADVGPNGPPCRTIGSGRVLGTRPR
jgi:hypothetical protein